MKTYILLSLSFALLCGASALKEEEAKRTAEFQSAVVSITRRFPPEKIGEKYITSSQGTAWFFQTRSHLITIEHVVTEPDLSKDGWTEVWLGQQNPDDPDDVRSERCEVRLLQIIPSEKGEGLALLELRQAFKWGKILEPAKEPCEEGDEVFSLGYVGGYLAYASGASHGIGKPDEAENTREGIPLYELTDNIDRQSFNSGASGSPILNTKGKVVGVASILLGHEYYSVSILGKNMEIGTAWGQPTHKAAPVDKLLNFKFPD